MGYETDMPNKTNKSNENRCKAAEYDGLTTANIYKLNLQCHGLEGGYNATACNSARAV